jgi:hypothetical protein
MHTRQEHGAHAGELAARLEDAHNRLAMLVEPCSEALWRAICPTEERAVGVVVHHIAARAALVARWAAAITAGELPPAVTMEMVYTDNAQHAHQHADCDKRATIDLLRRNGAAAASMVRSLSDEH